MATTLKQPLEDQIEQALTSGESRREIMARLRQTEDPQKLLFHLNNISNPGVRGKYLYLNLLLALVLLFVTSKKLLAIVLFGAFDLLLFMSLVVPIINFYLLREILRFRRIGYQFLLVLATLSLLHPENHFFPEFPLHLVMVAISGLLYLKMFPKSELIKTLER